MEHTLRAALIDWLRSGPAPLDALNAVEEEAPLRTAPPWLGLVAGASVDWSTKTQAGREIRLALELHTRGGEADGDATLVRAIHARIEDLPRLQDGFHIASIRFLRARAERRERNTRSTLIEYRFRVLEV